MGIQKIFLLLFLTICTQNLNGFCQEQSDASRYFVRFHVLIEETRQPACDAEIRVEGCDGSIVTAFTDSAGYCRISNLSGENTYMINITKYSCFSERYKIIQQDSCKMNTEIEILLVPIPIKPISLTVFQFSHGSARIRYDSAFSERLEEINMMMKENPTFVIQICGYTEPGERDGLAKKRASKIYQYCIDAGIEKERITCNTQPAIHAILRYSQDGCRPVPENFVITKEYLKMRSKADQQRIRQECRQVRFEIISTNYNPKK